MEQEYARSINCHGPLLVRRPAMSFNQASCYSSGSFSFTSSAGSQKALCASSTRCAVLRSVKSIRLTKSWAWLITRMSTSAYLWFVSPFRLFRYSFRYTKIRLTAFVVVLAERYNSDFSS